MLSLSTLTLLVSISALGADSSAGETVLLSFSADWCGPCQQMKPTVEHLAAQGYPVRELNVDRDRALAARYRVTSIPCFIMLVDGQEVDRSVGLTEPGRLMRMLAMAGDQRPAQAAPRALAQSPDDRQPTALALPGKAAHGPLAVGADTAPPGTFAPMPGAAAAEQGTTSNLAAPSELVDHLLQATVRLCVEDAEGSSYGTGTIIDTRAGEALVLTCGHIFRDSAGKGAIQIDHPGRAGTKPLQGRLLSYDLKRDVALVAFRPGGAPVAVARVADKADEVKLGQRVISVGCNSGQPATALSSRVTAIDKYLGPPNVEAAGMPVQGRSGGGLFDDRGRLVGVCFAADPSDDEGVYAALGSIQAEMDRLGLAALYQPPASAAQSAEELATADPPAMPSRMPKASTPDKRGIAAKSAGTQRTLAEAAARPRHSEVPSNQRPLAALSADERAALSEIAARADDAEVICIIRPRSNPKARSEIIVLDQASPEFLEQLSRAATTPDDRRLTSLELRRPAAAKSRP